MQEYSAIMEKLTDAVKHRLMLKEIDVRRNCSCQDEGKIRPHLIPMATLNKADELLGHHPYFFVYCGKCGIGNFYDAIVLLGAERYNQITGTDAASC